MLLLISILRLALSAIFALAGFTKLTDQSGTREAVKNFGAPKWAAPALAIVLPVLELAVAAGLLTTSFAWWSSIGALALLLMFIFAIGVNLSRGATHDCHCFGQLYSRPLGWPTLLRNVVFALAATIVIWQGALGINPSLIAVLREQFAEADTVTLILIGAIIASLIAAFIFWQQAAKEVPEKEEYGLPIGTLAPEFELEAYDGGKQSLSELIALGKPLLLLFTNPNCGPCITLFNEIKTWQDAHQQKLTIALITRGSIKDNFVTVSKNSLGRVLLQGEDNTSVRYRAEYTPMAVLVDQEGKIASRTAAGADDIRKMFDGPELNDGESVHVHHADVPQSEALA